MKTVTNQRQKQYQLDEKTREDANGGEIYQIVGDSGMWVMLLADHSKEKQLEVEKQLRGGYQGGESPREIVYNRGRFVGYTFMRPVRTVVDIPQEEEQVAVPVRKKHSDLAYLEDGDWVGFFESKTCRIIGTAIVVMLVSALQYYTLHSRMLGICEKYLSEDEFSVCSVITFSGASGIVGGLVFLFLLVKSDFYKIETVVLLAVEMLGYGVGIMLTYLLLALFSKLLVFMYVLAIAILPVAGAVIVMFLVLKSVFDNK